jgi:hypothetical protein
MVEKLKGCLNDQRFGRQITVYRMIAVIASTVGANIERPLEAILPT